MASKLEYLQRYMSAAPDAGDKKLRKKKKKASSGSTASAAQSRFRVVDADHEWEQDAPSKDAIEQKWELDAADEERPVVVADGEVIDDMSDLPVYVNAEELLEELHMKSREAADTAAHDDLSPPRRARAKENESASASTSAPTSDKPRRKYSSDGSPPRKRIASDSAPQRRRPRHDSEADDDASPPRRRRDTSARRGDRDDSDTKDASPPRRQRPTERQRRRKLSDSDDGASPPRRSQAASARSSASKEPRGDDSDASPVRYGRYQAPRDDASDRHTSKDAKSGDASPPRKRQATSSRTNDDDDDASPPRRRAGAAKPVGRTTDAATRVKPASPMRALTESQSSRHRRTDSLGRDIPETTRHASSTSTTRRTSERETRGRAGSDASPPRRQRRDSRKSSSRSRSRSNRRHRRSRSPRRSDRRSRRASPSRSKSRERQRDRGRRSPSRSNSRDRSRRRRSSPSRESSRHRADVHPDSRARDERSKRSPSPAKRANRATDTRASAAAQRETLSKDDTVAPTTKQPPAPARAGLFTATEFAAEHARKQAQNNLLRTADAQALGANAETVYRDKRGRKLDMLNEMVRQQEILDGKREREAREEYEWGTGKVQKQELASERERMAQIKQAPFARREDDPELEKLRKERVRAFDPINSKVFQDDALDGTKRSSKKSKKSKKKSVATKPVYAGPPAPPNRFGIQPGYRWDGVVRGTGWEEKLLLRQNKQSAVSEEAYKYAVADM